MLPVRNMSLPSAAKINGLAVIGDNIYVSQTDDPRIKVYDKHNLGPIKVLQADDEEISTSIVAVTIPILRENATLAELPVLESNSTRSTNSTGKNKLQLPDILEDCKSCDLGHKYLLFVCLKDKKRITCVDPDTGAAIFRENLRNRPVHISAGSCEDAAVLSALCGYSGSYRVSLFTVTADNLIPINEILLDQFNSVHCAVLLPNSALNRPRIFVASKGRLSRVSYFPDEFQVCLNSAEKIPHTTVDEVLNNSFCDDPVDNCFNVRKSLTFPADLAVDAVGKRIYIAQCSDKNGKIVSFGYDVIPHAIDKMPEHPMSLPHCLCLDPEDRMLYVGSARGEISVLRCSAQSL